jgi:predicted  nucleic acid-binding Zn-ribbon protein
MYEHRKDTRIEQLVRELRFKQSQLDQRDDELSGLKTKIHELHEQLKRMVEAYRDTSLKAAYEQRLAMEMANAMDRMDDIVLRPATWKPGTPTDADQIVSMVNECAVHGQYGP